MRYHTAELGNSTTINLPAFSGSFAICVVRIINFQPEKTCHQNAQSWRKEKCKTLLKPWFTTCNGFKRAQEAHLKSSSKCSTWGDANQKPLSRASSLGTVMIRSSIGMSNSSGIIPAPIPWSGMGPSPPLKTKTGIINFTACKLTHSFTKLQKLVMTQSK